MHTPTVPTPHFSSASAAPLRYRRRLRARAAIACGVALLFCALSAAALYEHRSLPFFPTVSTSEQMTAPKTPEAGLAPLNEPDLAQASLLLPSVADAANTPSSGPAHHPEAQTAQAEPAIMEEAAPQPDTAWLPLIARLAEDGFDAAAMRLAFAALASPPLPQFMGQKAVELHGGKAALILREGDGFAFAPPDYSRIAGGTSVAAGRRIMDSQRVLFEGLYKRYGVPAPFILAVLMVETGLGAQMGKQPALLALGSMAVTGSVQDVLPVVSGIDPTAEGLNDRLRERSAWAYAELKALIRYAHETGKDVWRIPGSVYGAIGMCQFMPSNVPLFAASARARQGQPDIFLLPDAAASVAKYLAAHGWKNATTPQAQVAVLRTYNHSDVYAATVYGVSTALMAPTTHASAQSTRNGGNAVTAARASAQASIPAGTKKNKPLEGLGTYSGLLE